MDKKKILYISIFSLIIGACLWAFISATFITSNFKKEILNKPKDEQQVDVDAVALTETKDGKKYWEIYAEKAQWDGEKKVALMEDIVGNFYKDDEVVISFISRNGSFNQETKVIKLFRDSHIVHKDGANIKADTFTFKGRDDDIVAEGHVRIERKGEILAYSDRAILFNKMQDFKIYGKTTTKIYSKKEIK